MRRSIVHAPRRRCATRRPKQSSPSLRTSLLISKTLTRFGPHIIPSALGLTCANLGTSSMKGTSIGSSRKPICAHYGAGLTPTRATHFGFLNDLHSTSDFFSLRLRRYQIRRLASRVCRTSKRCGQHGISLRKR